jgi:RHS repeat-associated protein
VNTSGNVPETNYWYPLAGCTSTLLPTQIPNPVITTLALDMNKGSGGGGTCSRLGNKFVCNPVNVTTGNKFEPALDLALSQPGVPFEFRRYYNNTQAADGPLGFGWTHSYSMSVQSLTTWTLGGVATPVRVEIIDADGRALYFTKIFQTYTDGYDHYYGESGVRDRLLWNPSTGYFFLRKKDSNLTYEFNTNGVLTEIYDTNGNTLTLTHINTNGFLLLTQVTNNFNKTLTIAYNSSNRISSVTDPRGNAITYTYDTNGNLTKVTYLDSNSVNYSYSNDVYHNLTDKKDTNSNVIGHWDYDSYNRVTAYYKYLNGTQQQEWANIIYGTSVPTVTTLNHQTGTTTYTFAINDGIGTVTNTDACGSTTCCGSTCTADVKKAYVYDSWVNLTDVQSITSGQTYTTHYTYDNPTNFYNLLGEVMTATEAYGSSSPRQTTYAYTPNSNDPFGLLLNQSTETKPSVVNPSADSKTITTNYDAWGNVTTRIEAGDVVSVGTLQPPYTTSYAYNPNIPGQLLSVTDPRGNVSTFTYYTSGNNQGQLQSITNALGQTTSYGGYDANGNVGTITDPNNITTQMTYDTRNRLSSTYNPTTGAYTQYSYDTHGNLASVSLSVGSVVYYTYTFTYNLADRITKIQDSFGNSIQYQYDVEGNRTGQSIYDLDETLRKSLSYTYDFYKRLMTIVNPDTTYTQYTYDQRGNPTALKDPNDNVKGFAYDAFNRPVTMTTQPLSTSISYGYDTQDNLTSVTDPNNNQTQYSFDDFGRINKIISPDTGTTIYSYDKAGNMIQKVDANGTTVNYSYDALNRVTSIDFSTDTNSSQKITYTYDSTSVTNGIGRLTGRTDPSGVYTFGYDTRGNMTTETETIAGASYTTTYAYNANNTLTSITYPSLRTVTYSLDQDQRISAVSATINGTPASLASSISYLPFGGITFLTYGNNQTLTQAYDNQYRISSIAVGSLFSLLYSYDADGNITSILDQINPTATGPLETPGTYTYDSGSNKLGSIAGSSPATFNFDDNGNITSTSQNNRTYGYDFLNRLITVSDTGSTYTYNALNQRVSKTTPAGTKIFHYDVQGHLIAETNAAGQTLVEYIYIGDKLLAMIRPTEQVYYYYTDHLGTPRMLVNSAGTTVWKTSYTPFGAATVTTSTVENNIRFPGQYYDVETGLHYNGNRYYDPTTGRYVTPDPIGLRGGINLYGYVGGNPVNGVDPLGLQASSSIKNDNKGKQGSSSCKNNEEKCHQSWLECYTNCINTLVPFNALSAAVNFNVIANGGYYLSGGTTTITVYGETVLVYASPIALGGAAGTAAGIMGEFGAAGVVATPGWVAGSSYGCMMSCAMNKCNY